MAITDFSASSIKGINIVKNVTNDINSQTNTLDLLDNSYDEDIFDLEFSSESFNLGNLISDFKDILEEMESI